jgi:4-hydroxybenzoate polyprenyltransferase
MSSGTQAPPTAPPARLAHWLPYAQLLRLPNVFTAMADIGLAALVTGALPDQVVPFLCLLLASSCLYCSGMVWNDYFDFEQDLRERPFRPLPSYRVSTTAAFRLGVGLSLAGLAFAGLACLRADGWYPGPLLIALILLGAIMSYNARLKRTNVGSINMGLCRFLNVSLGLTVVVVAHPVLWHLLLALVVGTYIVGVTWFARTEALVSKRLELTAAAVVMLAALPLALFLPVLGQQIGRSQEGAGTLAFLLGDLGHILFPYLLVAFGFYIGVPAVHAIRNPGPRQVQATVKRAVLGLILLDAVLATSLAGTPGLLLVLLLPPALYLGKWVYST